MEIINKTFKWLKRTNNIFHCEFATTMEITNRQGDLENDDIMGEKEDD